MRKTTALELTGRVFGRLTVLERAENSKGRHSSWLCKCECGNLVTTLGTALTTGHTKSCGCLPIIDLTGKSFDRWVVLERIESTLNGDAVWMCKCECGVKRAVLSKSLRTGRSKSCGCLYKLHPGESAFNKYYLSYVNDCAKSRGYDFSLSKEQFRNLTSNVCYFCKRPPSQVKKGRDLNGSYIANGIDRVNNDKGYHIENVVPCCKACNIAKSNRTVQEFKEWSVELYNNFGNKKD